MSKNSKALINRLTKIQNHLLVLEGTKSRISSELKAVTEDIEESQKQVEIKKKAHLFSLSFTAHRREDGIRAMSDTSTHALRAIYDEDMKIIFIKNEEKKNKAAFKMEMGLETTHNGKSRITGILDEAGGGLSETVSFAGRMAALEWLRYQGPLLLDEAWKSLSSDEKIERTGEFLRAYCDQSGRQIIFATHKLDVFKKYADHIISVYRDNDESKVKYYDE